jgi:hypothetical protein
MDDRDAWVCLFLGDAAGLGSRLQPRPGRARTLERQLSVERRAVAIALTLLAAGLVIRFWIGGQTAFPNDDAYISQHSARFLGEAEDPSYPDSRPLTGATSLLHVLVLWMAMRVLPPLGAVEFVSWLGAAVYFFAIGQLVCSRVRTPALQVLIILIGCTAGSTWFHLAGGQETAWAMAGAAFLLHYAQHDDGRSSIAASLAGILPWFRPDLVVLTIGFLARRFSSGRARFIRDASIVGLLALGYVATSWLLSGAPIPNTLSAKKEFFAYYSRPFELNALVLAVILGRWAFHFGPIVVALIVARRHPTDSVGVYALLAYLFVMTFMGPNVLEHNFFRYLHPVVVPVAVAGLCSVPSRSRQWLVASALIWIAWTTPSRWESYATWKAVSTGTQAEVAAWLSRHAAPGDRVLVHDAGYLSEHTTLELYDLVGLKTPASTTVHAELTGPSAGRLRADALHRIACRVDPHWYVALNGWEWVFDLTYGLSVKGWAAVPMLRTSRVSPGRGLEPLGYTVYRLIRSRGCATVASEPKR